MDQSKEGMGKGKKMGRETVKRERGRYKDRKWEMKK